MRQYIETNYKNLDWNNPPKTHPTFPPSLLRYRHIANYIYSLGIEFKQDVEDLEKQIRDFFVITLHQIFKTASPSDIKICMNYIPRNKADILISELLHMRFTYVYDPVGPINPMSDIIDFSAILLELFLAKEKPTNNLMIQIYELLENKPSMRLLFGRCQIYSTHNL